MSISTASYVSHVASNLQQLSTRRQEQIQVNLETGDSIRQSRQQSVERSMRDDTTQAERVNQIRTAALKAHGGSIDVWA
ncbi:hypothetical protein [Noviherbaspirillum autotrophicum]|uniref:Uncharacterized protein n=1 Tax=Noviherbaspirillum autotrophicum TaxID=709839 RepID=A0A0C1XYW3_9BURK|nr:hypothetical protein [Noviherbaspirillum autotrophicum]KIF79953.1 hypothetical protein TSA66_02525 [Noviherbaspirillum autotrophicum]